MTQYDHRDDAGVSALAGGLRHGADYGGGSLFTAASDKTSEALVQLTDQRQPLVITQQGEGRALLQDVASLEEAKETLALLNVLALGS